MSWRVIEGDCVEAMAAMDAASVDAVVTDPPYLLGFMGREWDMAGGRAMSDETRQRQLASGAGWTAKPYGASGKAAAPVAGEARAMQEWHEAWAREALRVLKPGGHLLAFGGTRTYHRLTCAVEDAGFEVRDCIAWLYGSGFPKSLDVSKAIDKAAGAAREGVGQRTDGRYAYGFTDEAKKALGGVVASESETGFSGAMGQITAPATPDAERWQGWGTALKPAFEPIVVARRPLAGTVAGNVLAHGTGALNVDGCRVEGVADRPGTTPPSTGERGSMAGALPRQDYEPNGAGRWPANVVLDPEAAALLDEQTGELHSQDPATRRSRSTVEGVTEMGTGASVEYADRGGASRFFYCPKADSDERHAGLAVASLFTPADAPDRNDHPTVKPIALMQWLVRLITPPGGTVLDPFAGSGTTGIAAVLEGMHFVGIEREAAYAAISRARIAHWATAAEAT